MRLSTLLFHGSFLRVAIFTPFPLPWQWWLNVQLSLLSMLLEVSHVDVLIFNWEDGLVSENFRQRDREIEWIDCHFTYKDLLFRLNSKKCHLEIWSWNFFKRPLKYPKNIQESRINQLWFVWYIIGLFWKDQIESYYENKDSKINYPEISSKKMSNHIFVSPGLFWITETIFLQLDALSFAKCELVCKDWRWNFIHNELWRKRVNRIIALPNSYKEFIAKKCRKELEDLEESHTFYRWVWVPI